MNAIEELASIIAQYATEDGTHPTALPRVHFIRSSSRREPLHALHEPALCIIAQGRKRVLLGEQTLEYDPEKYLIVSVALPVVGEVLEATPERPYLCLRLDLNCEMLTELVTDLKWDTTPSPPSAGLALSTVTPELFNAALRLLRLLHTPEDLDILAPLAEREILYRALKGDSTQTLHQIALGQGKLVQVNRALHWLKRNFMAPFSLELLSREARMSPSALHQHFRAVTQMSPLQYQKQLRLQEARRLLLGQKVDAATAGHAVGYESPSQFSREYRRLFGMPPLQDVAREYGKPQNKKPSL